MDRPQAVTVRLNSALHRDAIAIASLTGESLKAIVEEGLRKEVKRRLRDGKLADAVRVVTGFQAADGTSPQGLEHGGEVKMARSGG